MLLVGVVEEADVVVAGVGEAGGAGGAEAMRRAYAGVQGQIFPSALPRSAT